MNTIPIDDLCFFDTETRAEHVGVDDDVTSAGSYRYAKSAFVTVSTFAIGQATPFEVSLDRGFDADWLRWHEMPDALKRFHDRVEAGKAYYAAWNTGFDWQAWNQGTADFPLLAPGQYIDVMAQAVASCLPAKLEGAGQMLLGRGKQEDGKYLISKFSPADGWTPQDHPHEWLRFKSYGLEDTVLLRDIFRHTRPLFMAEWETYWASEEINARGQLIDLDFVRRANAVAKLNEARLNREIAALTEGAISTVNQTVKIAEYLYEYGDNNLRRILTKVYSDEFMVDANGDVTEDYAAAKIGISRDRLETAIVYLTNKENPSNFDRVALDLMIARQFGGSTSPKKFQKMLDQHDDGRLKGQYVFNGANQTGRFSARGVQVHNLTRSSLGPLEAAAINLINELEI